MAADVSCRLRRGKLRLQHPPGLTQDDVAAFPTRHPAQNQRVNVMRALVGVDGLEVRQHAHDVIFLVNAVSTMHVSSHSGNARLEFVSFSLLPPADALIKYFHYSVYGLSASATGVTLKCFSPSPPELDRAR